MNLIEKLHTIQKAVRYLRKDNEGYQYQYVSSSQTLATVRDKMDELGVMLIPRVTSQKYERAESENDRGKLSVQYFTEINLDFTWVNVDDSKETLTCPWYAQGKDSGEKGVGKALTYGEKYFLLKFFHIATDKDDPDAFQERRVEAGKRTRKGGVIPPQAPPPHTEAPPLNGDLPVRYPPTLDNPYFGKITGISDPVEGVTNGKPWIKWQIETKDLNMLCFDKGIAEVAANAMQDNAEVQVIWKLKKNKQTGNEACFAESIYILEPAV